MKTLHLSTIIVLVISAMVTTNVFAQNATNSSNSIPPIPSSILHSPVPTLSPSETQSVVNVALSIPELQNWSHDWKYVEMGFGSNNKLGTSDFKWQYASVVLKAPSSSAPIACSNDWWATVVIDMTTMKVVSATYPTMESHPCEVVILGGPATSGIIAPVIESPLQQELDAYSTQKEKHAEEEKQAKDISDAIILAEVGIPITTGISVGVLLFSRKRK
ncbi:MAG: hypothetical protein ACRDFB_06125 [Rhabdochlamydiaceae bacterium]